MGWFKHWFGTPYYALLYGHRDELEAKAWVETILARWRPPAGSEVLDLACGRGRHAYWLSRNGMKVTGVDISAESIAAAREKVPDGEFHVHDMRLPVATSRFHGACSLFTSLGYFDDIEDDRKVLRSVYAALRPGGHFVIDFMNTGKVLADLVAEENFVKEGVRFLIHRKLEAGTIIKDIRVEDGGRVNEFTEKVQALMPDQLEDMAVRAGFQIEARTDGPDASAFDPFLSDRFVLWLKKPEA